MNRLLVLAVSFLLTGAVQAQIVDPISAVAPKLRLGVHGNFTLSNLPGPRIASSQSLGDAYGTGWGGGVHIDLSFLAFSFRMSGDYLTYDLDVDRFRASYEDVFGPAVSMLNVEGGALKIYGVSVNGKLNILPVPIVTPYVTGGIGLAWFRLEETRTSIAGVPGRAFSSRSETGKTSLNLGAGADVSIGVDLFIEARYVWILMGEERSTYVPVTVGITLRLSEGGNDGVMDGWIDGYGAGARVIVLPPYILLTSRSGAGRTLAVTSSKPSSASA